MTPRHIWPVVLAMSVAVGLASDARADAPATQYFPFDYYDPLILDQMTGLTWQRFPGSSMSFASAAAYCQGLSLPPSTFWRVPSYKELLTLVDETPHLSYASGAAQPIALDPNAFPPDFEPSAYYWSSSLYPIKNDEAYAIDFSDGSATHLPVTGSNAYVRCVSGPTDVHHAN